MYTHVHTCILYTHVYAHCTCVAIVVIGVEHLDHKRCAPDGAQIQNASTFTNEKYKYQDINSKAKHKYKT